MYDHGCLLENQNTYQKDSVDIDLPKRVPTGFSGREGARRIISTQRSTKNEKKNKSVLPKSLMDGSHNHYQHIYLVLLLLPLGLHAITSY